MCSSLPGAEPACATAVTKGWAETEPGSKPRVGPECSDSAGSLWRVCPAPPPVGPVGIASNGCTGEEELREGAGGI